MCVCVLLVTWRANGIVLYMYEGKVLMDINIYNFHTKEVNIVPEINKIFPKLEKYIYID